MSAATDRRPLHSAPAAKTPALLSQGFRPFFLAAGVWSVTAVAIWIAVLTTGTILPSRFDPLSWHIHEMLFGFAMAAVAGFLLTAIPNWTKRLPVNGRPLALLVGLWLAGRLVCLVSGFIPFGAAAAADLAFPVVLVAVVAREIVAGHNWRNLPMVAAASVLGIADLLMHLEAEAVGVPAGLGWRLGLATIIILISVVAGRIVPSFTRNWLAKRGAARLPSSYGIVDRIALCVLPVALLGWVSDLMPRFSGTMLLLGAGFNVWRMLRWRGIATRHEPLLVILHIGYAWLTLGTALLGLSELGADVPLSVAVHALTVGAVGTMIMAVMPRVALGHTGRSLIADRATCLCFILIGLAALVRLAAALTAEWSMPLLVASACFWMAGFGLFVLRYGPMLLKPRPAR